MDRPGGLSYAIQGLELLGHGNQGVVSAPGCGELYGHGPGGYGQVNGDRGDTEGGPRGIVGGIAGAIESLGRGA